MFPNNQEEWIFITYQHNGANELIRENNGFTLLHDYQ